VVQRHISIGSHKLQQVTLFVIFDTWGETNKYGPTHHARLWQLWPLWQLCMLLLLLLLFASLKY